MRCKAVPFVLAVFAAMAIAAPALAGTLCGTVRDGVTSLPVARAGVFLRTPAGAYTGLYGATDMAGAFCITGVAAGTYDVEVLVDHYRVAYLRGVVVTASSTDVDLSVTLGGVRFSAPSPNPARTSTQFTWTLPVPGRVRLSVMDVRGRFVRGWQSDELSAGEHYQQWDLTDVYGRPVGAGVYYVQLDTAAGRLVRALVRMR